MGPKGAWTLPGTLLFITMAHCHHRVYSYLSDLTHQKCSLACSLKWLWSVHSRKNILFPTWRDWDKTKTAYPETFCQNPVLLTRKSDANILLTPRKYNLLKSLVASSLMLKMNIPKDCPQVIAYKEWTITGSLNKFLENTLISSIVWDMYTGNQNKHFTEITKYLC